MISRSLFGNISSTNPITKDELKSLDVLKPLSGHLGILRNIFGSAGGIDTYLNNNNKYFQFTYDRVRMSIIGLTNKHLRVIGILANFAYKYFSEKRFLKLLPNDVYKLTILNNLYNSKGTIVFDPLNRVYKFKYEIYSEEDPEMVIGEREELVSIDSLNKLLDDYYIIKTDNRIELHPWTIRIMDYIKFETQKLNQIIEPEADSNLNGAISLSLRSNS